MGGATVQRTSERDRQEHGLARYVSLRAPRFTELRLSGELGRTVREAVAGVTGGDVGGVGFSVAPWSRPDLYALGYTLEDHTWVRDAVLARATREAGWYGRGQFADHITSHYLIRRQIRSGRFVAELRTALLAHLNAILALHPELLRDGGALRVAHAYAPDDYDEAERMLDGGEHSLREVMNRIG